MKTSNSVNGGAFIDSFTNTCEFRITSGVFTPTESLFRCDVSPEVLAGISEQGDYRIRDRDPERTREQRLHVSYLYIHSHSGGERWNGVETFDG